VRAAAALVAVFVASVACKRDKAPAADSGAAAAGQATSARTDLPPAAPATASAGTTASAPNAPGCVSEGDWQACSIEKRLTDAGFVPIRKGPAPTGIFSVAGTTYTLGAAELSVYLFRSAKERAAATAAIDTVTVAPRGGASPWSSPPTLITSNNLAAVLLSDNGRLIERVQNAITAGLPSAVH
jgi:hypothetical protein